MASIPQDVAAYGGRIADYIDRYTNDIASSIRDTLENSSWIPKNLRPEPTKSGHYFLRAPPPRSTYEKVITWTSQHRTHIAVIVAFASTTYVMVQRSKKAHARKRRAKKLPNGGKKEIVILACSSFHDPLSRSLALDLERRGYVVYVTVSSTEEDSLIQQEGKADLRPLWMDLTSTVPNPAVDIHPNLEPIRELLTQHQPQAAQGRAGAGSSMGNMTLAGIVVFPGCSGYPTGPLALLPPTDVVDTVNTRLLSPILSIQQFLPLLTSHNNDSSPPSIIIAYPSIPASLSPPRQMPETLIASSLSALAASLRRDLSSNNTNITIHELKLGNFDLGSVSNTSTKPSSSSQQRNTPFWGASTSPRPANSQLVHQPSPWHSSQRAALQRSTLTQPSFIKGSSARELHNAVFDALAPPQIFRPFGLFDWPMTSKRHSTIFVGSGARLYDIIGNWVPGGVVGAVMTFRERRRAKRDWKDVSAARREQQDELRTAEAGLGQSIQLGESGVWEKV